MRIDDDLPDFDVRTRHEVVVQASVDRRDTRLLNFELARSPLIRRRYRLRGMPLSQPAVI